ncbi:MAG TPA: xanthine dehydrogenase family protein molybdopterin-binding subunit [Actinomycetospora sp.]|uniref:xanthine dehydrogenase family protein molybdopterin-binding subunit n=1 Tax=Actinomycetospora sp. TaxID=1872135 RepID=UPI002F40625A
MAQAPERVVPPVGGLPVTDSGPAVGRPVDRVDGAVKTSGRARYTADVSCPDLAHAALVHATIPRGRITGVDAAAALSVEGVLAVITHENAPPMPAPPRENLANPSTTAGGARVAYVTTDQVHWNGQPVAVVVAETPEAAAGAARLVCVEYEALPAATDFLDAVPGATPVKAGLLEVGEERTGDAPAALAAAPVSVDHRYTTPAQNHNAIEPHATTAAWDGDRLTVHDTTQNIDWARRYLAACFGIPVGNVRMIAQYVGGGFGGKSSVWAGTVLAALAARVTGRPVRMALSRESVFRTVGGRTPTRQRVALGVERDGRLTALVHTGVSAVGRVGGRSEQVAAQSRFLYAAPNLLIRHDTTEMDVLPSTFMRAPGEAVGMFALESAVDELAVELGMDPVELRMRNQPERSPVGGKRYSRQNVREVLTRGAERFGWADRDPEPRSMRDGRWLVGWGVAGAFQVPAQLFADVAVQLNADATVVVRTSLHEIGVGAATATSQIAADELGVPVEAVTVEHGDSEQPAAPGAIGSSQTASVAAAVLLACEQLRREALDLARRAPESPLHGRRPAELRPAHGGLYAGNVGESWTAILTRAGRSRLEARTGSDSPPRQTLRTVRAMAGLVLEQRRWVKAATGAHFCEVRVDPDTGEVRVTRWVAVFDVGRVINAKLATSQLRGGIVMGIGAALEEETLVDPRTGRSMNAGLAGYHVPVHADVPTLDVSYLGEPDPRTPLGLLGVGEVGITGAPAAVANAVHHATGVRVRDLPITLDRLL